MRISESEYAKLKEAALTVCSFCPHATTHYPCFECNLSATVSTYKTKLDETEVPR
jgi:hypothetical protein